MDATLASTRVLQECEKTENATNGCEVTPQIVQALQECQKTSDEAVIPAPTFQLLQECEKSNDDVKTTNEVTPSTAQVLQEREKTSDYVETTDEVIAQISVEECNETGKTSKRKTVRVKRQITDTKGTDGKQ